MKDQLRELVTQYHPGVIWFDGGWMRGWTQEDGKTIVDYLHQLDPRLLINNRANYDGDYGTPEQEIPATGLPGRDWETCMTINDTWGFKRDDDHWKSAESLVRNLIDIASKGGNYLLNVGPTAEGVIPEPEVQRLSRMGQWLKVNGPAIYGATASPFADLPWGRCTRKGSTLYLHVFDWPTDGRLLVPLKNPVTRAYLMTDPRKPLSHSSEGGHLQVQVPAAAPDPIASVVAVEIQGSPEVDNTQVSNTHIR
jgi:alpha-L-fucosidase